MGDRLADLRERAEFLGLCCDGWRWRADDVVIMRHPYPDHVRWYLLFGDWGDDSCVKSRYVLRADRYTTDRVCDPW